MSLQEPIYTSNVCLHIIKKIWFEENVSMSVYKFNILFLNFKINII